MNPQARESPPSPPQLHTLSLSLALSRLSGESHPTCVSQQEPFRKSKTRHWKTYTPLLASSGELKPTREITVGFEYMMMHVCINIFFTRNPIIEMENCPTKARVVDAAARVVARQQV